MAKKPSTTPMADVTRFPAEVTIVGSVESGDMIITMAQTAEQPPTEPPVSPPVSPPESPPPVSPPVSPPEPPPGGDKPPAQLWEPPSWLRKDMDVVSIPNTPRPGYLVQTTDPVFRSKITRVTGDPGSSIRNISGARWGDQARHHYQSDQAWNVDETLIFLDTNKGSGAAGVSALFLDGETYEPAFGANNKPSGDIRWHNDPELMIFAGGSGGNKLGTWNPKTGQQRIIRDFGSGYSEFTFGPWEGSPSEDGDMVVITGKKGGSGVAFAYKISTDTKSPDIMNSSIGSGDVNAVRISSKGTYMVWGNRPDTVIVTDLQGRVVTTLPNNYVSHYDVITDSGGDEVVVGRVNSSSANQGPSGRISKYRLRDGRRTGLSQGGWCSHTSARSQAAHRWSVSDAYLEGTTYPPYNGELIMCALTGSAVYRLCHTHTTKTVDYVAQTQASHARHPGRVIFASPWGASGSAPRPVGCYVCDFRS